ncbi:MAG: hypothetical protein WDM90_09970 [Ferruginibacter sp.]
MKKTILSITALLLCATVLFTACKKIKSKDADAVTESQIQADDQSAFALSTDEVTTDASQVVENVYAVSGTNGLLHNFLDPSNTTITYDTVNTIRVITITYHGLNFAGNRNRVGVATITAKAGVLWKDAGAQLTITYNNLKITRVYDNKSIVINGNAVVTNISGGTLHNLATLGTITHTVASSGMSITFDDGTQRTWQIAQQRVFTYNNGLVISITGTHTDGTTTGICDWGNNRLGNPFVTQIVDPLVIRQDCDYRLTAGRVKHSRLLASVDVTFGLNASGTPTSCPAAGTPYYMKIIWSNTLGVSVTVILPY